MTNKKHIFSIIFIGSLLTGCATGPSPTGIGLYTDVKGPITATSLPATKTGKACAQTVLGIVNTGDASIDSAKKAGDISLVSSVDYETTGSYPSLVSSVDYETTGSYPFYGKTCVVVRGQ
ncbi:TRL-like family protein [Salmonella enterica]|nr:TRL-like family protein [Salmonella enterica]